MKKPRNIFLKFISNLLGVLFVIFILVCLVSLFKFLYLPSKPTAVPEDIPVNKFSKTIVQPLGAEHFHILDEAVYSDEENAPMCLQCHGNFCHAKPEELRSFYNMHTFYLACETCHIREKEGGKFELKWFDDISGEVVKKLKGKDGNYGAKIVPVKDGKRLDDFPKKELALEFMRLEDTYAEAEKKKIQEEIMEHISKEALTCKDCHKRDGYINFSTLGYAQDRINRLTRLEIIQLIDEYKEFYLPTMFDPRKVGREGGT
jgi:cytochrome c553